MPLSTVKSKELVQNCNILTCYSVVIVRSVTTGKSCAQSLVDAETQSKMQTTE